MAWQDPFPSAAATPANNASPSLAAPVKAPVTGWKDPFPTAPPSTAVATQAPLRTPAPAKGVIPGGATIPGLGDTTAANEENNASTASTWLKGKIADPGKTLVDDFPTLTASLADLQTNPLNLGHSIKDILLTPFTDARDISDAFNTALGHLLTGIKNKAPASQDVSDGLQAATTFAGGLISPITTWFNVANKIPIVGDVSKLLFNVPLATLGDASGDAGVKALNQLPISPEAKQNLEPGIRAVSTLAAQLVAGGEVTPDVLGMLTTHFGATDAQTIVDKAQEVAEEAKNKAPAPVSAAPEEIPAPKAPETVEAPTPEAKPTDEAQPPAAATAQETPTPPAATAKPETSPEAAPTTTAAPETKPVEEPTPDKTSGIAKSIEARAIEKGLTDKFDNLAGFEGRNVKDQASKVADLITNDEAKAREVVNGDAPVPEGMSGTMLLKGMEDHALKNGDVELLRKLASSPLTSDTSVHAQEMRFAAERNPESPLSAMQDIKNAREKAAQDRLGKGKDLTKEKTRVAGEIKDRIRKTAPTKQTWAEFINTIQCR